MKKMKWIQKGISALLALNMVLSLAPIPAFAGTTDNLCEHHTEHSAEVCGYVEAVQGQPCNHQCGEECTVTACVHDHEAKGCVYTPARDLVPCDHVHDGTCNYNEAEDTCDHQHGECAYQEPVEESWDCAHVCTVDSGCVKTRCTHVCPEDDCGFVAAAGHECEFVCTECESQTEDTVQEPSAVDAAKARVAALPTTEQAAAMTEEEKDALSLQLTALDNDLWELVEEEVLPMEEYIGLYEVIDALNAVLIGDAPQLLADVAAVNGTNYSSLEAAYNAVLEGGTITLIADCTVATFEINVSKNFTLDLKGHTIDGNVTVRAGTLTVKDSGTGGKITGQLAASTYDMSGQSPRINITGGTIGSVRNGSVTGGVTISGGTVGTITHNSGTLNVKGGTITADKGIEGTSVQGSVNISGGTFNCTTDIIGYGALRIWLKGGTFNNGITVDGAIDLAEILEANYRYYVNGSEESATLLEGQKTLAGSTITVERGPYQIAVPTGIHCSAYADKTQARPGEIVTITVTPDSGYVLQELSGLCSTGSSYPSLVQWTKVNDNTYKFAMPAADVYLIYATAKKQYTITFKDSENQCTAHSNVTVFEEDEYFLPNYTHHHSDPDKVFAGWVVNGAVKQPGETITISGDVTIDHKWGNKVKGISLSAEELVVTFYPDCYNDDMSFEEHMALIGELSRSLTATISPDTATNKNINWSISNNNIVTFYPQEATASIMPKDLSSLQEGTAVITAASAEDPDIYDTCTVTYKKHQCTDATYSATGNTITETCTDPKCGKTNTVTLTVPADSIYDGTAKTAGHGDFLNPNANPQIVYQFNAEKAENYAAHTGDPVNAGYYTAALKVGQVSTEAQSFAISKKTLTDLAIANTDKEYDGSVAADDSYISCKGIVEADLVKIAADIAYADANAGEGKVITATNLEITGDKAGNYCLPEDTTDITGTGTITKKPVTVTVDNNLFKTYGDKDPQLTWSASPAPVDGDVLSVQVTREDGETVKDGGYIITVTEVQGDNPNYEITFVPGIFTIKPKELTIDIIAKKQFDNTADIDLVKDTFQYTLTPNQVLKNDEVILDSYTGKAYFSGSEVGENLTVNLDDNFTISGKDAENYTLTQPSGVTGRIYNTYDAAAGTDFKVSHGGWTNGDVTITAGANRFLAREIEGEWTAKLTYSDQAENRDGKTAAFFVKNTDNGDISLQETVTYKIDKTNPTGTIALENRTPWQELVSNITFGLFFNYEQTVTITAADTLSGIAKVEYLESDKALDQTALEALESESWKEYASPIPVALEDLKQFVYYAKITDEAGNVIYLSTDGAEYDTTDPVVAGVTAGETYYITKPVTVTDSNLLSTTLTTGTGEPAEQTAPFNLPGNVDAVYTITASDRAGNQTVLSVTMKPVETMDDELDAGESPMTVDNVKLSDKTRITAILNQAEALMEETDVASEDEALQKIVDRMQTLLDAIAAAEAVIEQIKAIPGADKAQPDNKDHLEALLKTQAAYNQLSANGKTMVGADNKAVLDGVATALHTYRIIAGDGGKHTKYSGKTLSFTANGPVKMELSNGKTISFKGILVDGAAVAAGNYTVVSGSTVVTLKSSYLDSLKGGKHKIVFLYDHMGTEYRTNEASFRVSIPSDNPKTGDDLDHLSRNGLAMTGLLCVAMLVLLFPGKKGKYQR